ncbi:MAG: DUF502 domain-containing protein [Candidatus Omnitrophica bacterium]|nr:DUF502 domain-containing protein [Candidatus Omnitrophota bacterium]
MSKVRRYFVTGLLITLPVFFTLYFFFIIFRFIDGICGKVINIFLIKHFGFGIPGLGIILGLLTVVLVGFIATNFFGKKLFHVIEAWFLKLPLIRQVYPAAKQVVSSIISRESRAFKKVVMVEYPSKGIWSIGFVTNDSFKEAEKAVGEELLHVFIATSPSPLTGYLVLMPKSVVKDLNISVEQGLKLIVSGGIIKPL